MTLNGINSGYPTTETTYTQKEATSKATAEAAKTAVTEMTGVIYEHTEETDTDTSKKLYSNIVEQMKADANQRTAQLESLVQKLLMKQGDTYTSIWDALRSGELEVDPETQAAAKASIQEGGEYSVDAVSDRIVDFAKALTGGDADKADEMLAAFKKGFEEATKTWGGKLPEISQKTYDAVLAKFDAWKNGTKEAEVEGVKTEI